MVRGVNKSGVAVGEAAKTLRARSAIFSGKFIQKRKSEPSLRARSRIFRARRAVSGDPGEARNIWLSGRRFILAGGVRRYEWSQPESPEAH